jgi:hypothetical protein
MGEFTGIGEDREIEHKRVEENKFQHLKRHGQHLRKCEKSNLVAQE